MWSNKRRQKPVYTAESKIVCSLLKYIGTCTNIDRNEVVWFKLAGNKETTDIAVNYLSGLMKEAFSGKKKHREHLKRKVEQFKRSHLRNFLAQLDAVAPYVRLSLVRRRQMMDNGGQLPVSIAVVNSSMASPSGGTETMPKSGKRTADWITTQNEPNEHVPAVKVSRLATRPLPFGMTSFCPSANVRHRFRRLPLNEAELHVMHMNNGDLPAGIMRKQFVNRLLAKAEIDIVLEQFSETTSSSWGYTIRLEGVPDAMFCVSYAMNSTDSSHYVEDGMIQFILGRLSSRDPSFIPFMAAGAVYTNQRSADHLATYVSVALKYVRAQQGLSHEAMDKHQIAESLNDCLTEYWRVNLTALSAHLASSLHDNVIVPLPSE